MHTVDLSSLVDSEQYEPDPVEHTVLTPAEGARHMSEEMAELFGLGFDVDELPRRRVPSCDANLMASQPGRSSGPFTPSPRAARSAETAVASCDVASYLTHQCDFMSHLDAPMFADLVV